MVCQQQIKNKTRSSHTLIFFFMTDISGDRRALCTCISAALLAACRGSQQPIDVPGEMPPSRAIAAHANRRDFWMLPDASDDASEINVHLSSEQQN